MKKKVNILFNVIILPATGILLLYLAFKEINLNEAINTLLKAKYEWVFISLVFAIGGFIFRALRWQVLLSSSNFNAKTKTIIYAVIMAYFANMAIPRIGEVIRCTVLKKTDKIPIEISLGTVITERIFDVLILLIVIFLVIISDISLFYSFFYNELLLPILQNYFSLLMLMPITIVLLIIFLITIKKNSKNVLNNKINQLLQGFINGLMSLFSMKKPFKFIFYTILIWICYLLMTYTVFFALPSTSVLTLKHSVFVLAIGGIAMSLPIQNGFGAFHWMVSRGLTLFGISQFDGLLYATLCHESQTFLILILGVIVMLIIFLFYKN